MRLLRRSILGLGSRLHRDDGGQSMALVALSSFLICCFIIILLNNGSNLTHKVQCQNAVDASAISAATWQARGMNLISVTNIMQSMLLAEAMFLAAMPVAILTSLEIATDNFGCYCDIFCAFDIGKCIQSGFEMFNMGLSEVLIWFYLFDWIEFVFDRMEELSDVAATVQGAFQAMAMTASTTIAQTNGLDYAFAWPNTMPIEEGEYKDLCPTMTSGDDGGYEAWWNTGVVTAMLYFAITEYQAEAYGPAFAAYQHWALGPLGSPTQQLPFQMFFGEGAPLAMGNAWWEANVDLVYAAECLGGISTLGLYTDTDRSKPLLLVDDFDKSAKYVAVGYDAPEKGDSLLLPDYFHNSYNDAFGTVVVAQAEVLNVMEDDTEQAMFVPRWHARLSPVTELSEMDPAITGYLYGTEGLPWPDPTAAARITVWVALLKDLTQLMVTH